LFSIMIFKMKKVFVGLLVFGVFILGFVTTYLFLTFSKIFVKKTEISATPTPVSYTKSTPEALTNPKGVFNVLLLGYGGEGHSGGSLTDSIIVAHIDTNTKKYTLISIPRDLWVSGNRKINAEGSANGFQNVASAVKGVTGLPIDNFVSVDFANYSKIIDNLGGVSVEVPKAFSDSFYPVPGLENETCGITAEQINEFKSKYSGFELEKQFTCRYEKISYGKGPATLNGTEALKFVRSRHGDSDFGRSARQFAVLAGIGKKLISLKSLNKLDSTIDLFSKMVRTDLSAGKIKSLIEAFGDASTYTKNEIQLTTENVLNEGKSSDGQYILTPKAGSFNFSEIKNYINGNL
ncbi:MAG: LCP family protein, partial [Candidatus Woesebacteria bacterium]|nr:LCP family protein [Candidatus Woesebacteria bacterium]